MTEHVDSTDGVRLAAHLATPRRPEPRLPGLVLCHGFPIDAVGALGAPATFPQLADRIATTVGWAVVTFGFRGCGESTGDFSLPGWVDDVHATVEFLRSQPGVSDVWLAGFGTGGAVCLAAAADDADIRGVAALGAPAGFEDWARHPRRLLQHAREIGVVRHPEFPESVDQWSRSLRDLKPVDAAGALAPRPLLVVHGSEDMSVPHFDGRVISDAHGSAELRVISGASHALRHDPRAVAVLLGWLDRQKHAVPAG